MQYRRLGKTDLEVSAVSFGAIKLSQIDLRYGLFEPGDIVVDLGAAPGGWSQVARERIGAKGRIIAVDLSAMS